MANQHTITSQIEDIRKEIQEVRKDTESLKKRMDISETTQGTHTDILKNVEQSMQVLIGIGKWLLGLITTVGVTVLAAYLIGHLPK